MKSYQSWILIGLVAAIAAVYIYNNRKEDTPTVAAPVTTE